MLKKIKSFIGVLKDSKNPRKLIFAQMLVKSGLNRFVTIPMNGYKLRFSDSALAVTLYADRNERHDDEDLVKKILRPGDTYVDVGANIGTLALTAAVAVRPNGKVIAIEAHPATYKNLAENIRLNKFENIQAINSAAGNSNGSTRFSNVNSDDQNKVVTDDTTGIEVPVSTLDILAHDVDAIKLLKIDVEGYEKFVLEGAEKTMLKTNVILFESWDKHFKEFNYSSADVIMLLQQKAFKVYRIVGKLLEQVSENHTSLHCENLLAIKDIIRFCEHTGFKIQIPK